MGFGDEVERSLAARAKEDASDIDRRAAEIKRFMNDYLAALGEARAYLTEHLKPTRMLLEERMIRSNRYSPEGYVLHRRSIAYGSGIHVSPSPRSAIFDMLLVNGEVWKKRFEGTTGDVYDPMDDVAGGFKSTHIFGLRVWSGPEGALAKPSNDWDAREKPFRDYLVQVCAEAHKTHEARSA